MKKRAHLDSLVRIALCLMEGLGTPFSLEHAERLRTGDWRGIISAEVSPRSYQDATSYYKDAIAANFLRKLEEVPISVDRREAAYQKWLSGERSCYKTNERLYRYLYRYSSDGEWTEADERIAEFLGRVKRQISEWIGPKPPSMPAGRFGPGATFSDRGKLTLIPDKITARPSLTSGAIAVLPQFRDTLWGRISAASKRALIHVRGNRFATVPKTALTDRSIGAEPSVNVFYQLAYGTAMRDLLRKNSRYGVRKHGWDLNYAQEVHGRVARESSRTREFATLDLSNASDTVAYILVKILLPQYWFHVLDCLRSTHTLVDKHWVRLEKFSSMGNGFTFELETIIFAAIACTVSKEAGHAGILGHDVFVFGDDIIVKDDVVSMLKPCLEFLGFTLNDQKSFWGDIPFRESCGEDYFDGLPVRPHFVKEIPSEPQDYIALANGLYQVNKAFLTHGEDRHCLGAWFRTLDCIPRDVRRHCRGPEALGDIVIHDEESRWSIHWEEQVRYIQAYLPYEYPKVSWKHFKPEVVLACAAYGTGGGIDGGLTPRNAVPNYRRAKVEFS